jgi:hypothetical protein
MTGNAIHDAIKDRTPMQQNRPGPGRRMSLRKTLIVVAASAVLGPAAITTTAALAFGPPPPPPALASPPPGLAGPPPGLGSLPHAGPGALPHPGLGGLPRTGAAGAAAPSRLAGPSDFRGGDHGIAGNLRGSSAGISYGRSGAYNYGRSGAHHYGRNGWRNRYFGVFAYTNDGSAYADDGCYYTYRRNRRVVVCSGE